MEWKIVIINVTLLKQFLASAMYKSKWSSKPDESIFDSLNSVWFKSSSVFIVSARIS
jgi:hypothetical protein